MLPPFEGFDEPAHVSYLQQVAERKSWPRYGDPISREVEQYFARGPTPPEISATKRFGYSEFFRLNLDEIANGRSAVHSLRDPNRSWESGSQANWQAQQPPFYYLILAPLYTITKGLSLAGQLFVLRSVSYFFAWCALCLAVLTIRKDASTRSPRLRTALLFAPALWCFILPTWFPEMGRVGNDSLVALLVAVSSLVYIRLLRSGGLGLHLLLGAVCGLGLLTKATFIPVPVVFAAGLLWRLYRDRGKDAAVHHRSVGLLVFCVTTLVIAAWWYVLKTVETGSVAGLNDATAVARGGGLLQGLQDHGSLRLLLIGYFHIVRSFLWSSTWSFAMPGDLALVPMFILLFLLIAGYLRGLARWRPTFVDWTSALLLLLVLIGLSYHLLIFLALGLAGTPGWYLHAFVAAFSPLLGLAVAALMRSRITAWALVALQGYAALCFLPWVTAVQWLTFAGCDVRRPGPIVFELPRVTGCPDTMSFYERLSVLAYPRLAFLLVGIGLVLLIGGLIPAIAELLGRHGPRSGHRRF